MDHTILYYSDPYYTVLHYNIRNYATLLGCSFLAMVLCVLEAAGSQRFSSSEYVLNLYRNLTKKTLGLY